MRIKMDEDLPKAAIQMLRGQGHEALGVIEQGMGGTKDPDLWRAVQAEHRFLVTADKGSATSAAICPGRIRESCCCALTKPEFGRCSIFSNAFSPLTILKSWPGRSSSPRHEAFVSGGPRLEGVPSCPAPTLEESKLCYTSITAENGIATGLL